MKLNKYLLALTTGILLSISVAGAIPVSDFSATPPVEYVDGTTIPVEDVLTHKLYCSSSSGGPYNTFYDIADLTSFNQDVATCVQGQPGIYFFVATSTSSVYGSESAFSNETSKTYTAIDLGKVPRAPAFLQVQ